MGAPCVIFPDDARGFLYIRDYLSVVIAFVKITGDVNYTVLIEETN
jgi:hypothetical protein